MYILYILYIASLIIYTILYIGHNSLILRYLAKIITNIDFNGER